MESSDSEENTKVRLGFRLRISEGWKGVFSKKNPPKHPSEIFAGTGLKTLKKPGAAKNEENGTAEPHEETPRSGLSDMHRPPPPLCQPTSPPFKNERLARGTRNECKTLDARYTKKGDYELNESTRPFHYAAHRDAYSIFDEYCMVITRRFDQDNKLISTTLKIQSPFLLKAFRTIVKYYPDNPVNIGNTVNVKDPPALIYHYRHELAEYASQEDVDDQTKLHIDYVLEHLQIYIGEDIQQCDKYLAKGLIKFEWLWMIFRSGGLVYSSKSDQLYFFQRGELTQTQSGELVYKLHCNIVNYDGKDVGKEEVQLFIPAYESARELTALVIMPLEHCVDVEGLKNKLIKRANTFLELRGVHARNHDTIGRVMIDCKIFQERQGENIALSKKCACTCRVCKKEDEEKPEDYDHELRELSEQDMLITSSIVLGFSLSKHNWMSFRISDLSQIKWSDNAIESLVMDTSQKKVILSLVTSPIFLKGLSTDVIGWKAKGLVVLLHGSPGTGKTLTAECVCEKLHRPLYNASGGELGSTPAGLEAALKDILELSARWNAIILIDEADVFLEQRTAADIHRNSLVSKYFEGMLFLTTNRVERFDKAFTSRIHLALNFPDLSPDMRREIWVNSLKRLPAEDVDIDYDELSSPLNSLVEAKLNGRVITYAVRTAKALAEADKEKLTVKHLRDVVDVYQKFLATLPYR
ncbi:MAG: hypothetical protein M1834_001209 [Cirrosporium novae-zelandiae]|nr:MAG: hypothetical protein M1834_001209 [Cirrosporium novae-zelandiae]